MNIKPIYLKNSDVFESLIRDYFNKSSEVLFSKFGSNGQRQNGIDLIQCQKNKVGKYDVIQCKNYTEKKLTLNQIKDDLSKLMHCQIPIGKVIYVTSSKPDSTLQQQVALDLFIQGNFDFKLDFYDEIFESILHHEDLILKYFPSFILSAKDDYLTAFRNNDIQTLKHFSHCLKRPLADYPTLIENSLHHYHSDIEDLNLMIDVFLNELPMIEVKIDTTTYHFLFHDFDLNELFNILSQLKYEILEFTMQNFEHEFIDNGPNLFLFRPIENTTIHNSNYILLSKRKQLLMKYKSTFTLFLSYLRTNYPEISILYRNTYP